MANLMKIHLDLRVDEAARHSSLVPARQYSVRRDDCYSLTSLHQRDLRIQVIHCQSGLILDSGSREMLIDKMLKGRGLRQGDEILSFECRPASRRAA